ncbi:DEAD/DEAH box helicase [Bacillus sp. UMB0728]|uniref:DEAD/DEAH box helicase n=1 Tax=Bacillus sp. UMB0728 TaxID=2066052 RepID=UPI00215294C8|nr:DEAD/DEAH box helicase [Bacillus sp. UMB0728]
MRLNFKHLGISDPLIHKLAAQGINEPTAVQEKAIPIVLEGRDIIAQAQTGTGKTLAFILPILEKIDPSNGSTQALIVTPTRELALQITSEVKKLIEDMPDLNVLAVYGGQDVEKQLHKLQRQTQIVVATPGRLLDHLRRGTVQLDEVSFLVLDEADQMLHIGFLNEMELIISQTPASRQTMLFSATMPDDIRKLSKKHLKEPESIRIEKTFVPEKAIEQLAIFTTDRAKQNALISRIREDRPFMAIIFCRTIRRATKLYDALKSQRFSCEELHGDLTQAKREKVMKKFRNAEIQFLIATDVAARGLDVEGVTHVYNYDIPQDSESYVHRIGRTGRAGKDGLAVTFYAEKDEAALKAIEQELKIRLPKEESTATANATADGEKSSSGDKPKKRSDRDRRAGGAESRRRTGGRTEGRGSREVRSTRSGERRTRSSEGRRADGEIRSYTHDERRENGRRSGDRRSLSDGRRSSGGRSAERNPRPDGIRSSGERSRDSQRSRSSDGTGGRRDRGPASNGSRGPGRGRR